MLNKAVLLLTIAFSMLLPQVSSAKYCQTQNGIYLSYHKMEYGIWIDLAKSGLGKFATGGADLAVRHQVDDFWELASARGPNGHLRGTHHAVMLAKDQNHCWDTPALPAGAVATSEMSKLAMADVMMSPGFNRHIGYKELKDGQSFFCHGITANAWCEVVDETY